MGGGGRGRTRLFDALFQTAIGPTSIFQTRLTAVKGAPTIGGKVQTLIGTVGMRIVPRSGTSMDAFQAAPSILRILATPVPPSEAQFR